LATLKNYNRLNVPSDYFDEAMNRLVNRFLNIPLEAVLHPLSVSARKGADSQKAAIRKAKQVTKKELSAEEWLERGYKLNDNSDDELHCYTQASLLNPSYAEAYSNPSAVRQAQGDLEGAIKDSEEAIRLKPDFAMAYNNRGLARADKGDLTEAIKDYNEAIRLKPDYANAYYGRGIARYDQGDFAAAIKDYTEAIRLKPDYADAYYNRALVWEKKKDYRKAIADYQKYLELF
jgi:tetratricopeptide (TPR) repeat protein